MITCSKCQVKLNPATVIPPGRKIKCPRCAAIFVPSPDPPRPVQQAPPGPARPDVEIDDEKAEIDTVAELDEEASPRPRRKGRATRKPKSAVVTYVVAGVVLLVIAGAGGLISYWVSRPKLGEDLAANTTELSWKEFATPDGRLRVQLPGVPHVGQLEGKPPEYHQYILELMNPAVSSYRLTYVDFDEAPPNAAAVTEMFDSLRDGIIRAIPGAKLVGEKASTLGKNPGREYAIRSDMYHTSQVIRVCIVSRTLYVLAVGGLQVTPDSAEALRCFDSFQITAPAPAATPAQTKL